MENRYKKLGLNIPEILLPVSGTDLTKWAVIACDQYTSQPDYWDKVNGEVGGSPSTLRLTFPEIYLKEEDKDSRIHNINEAMAQYLSDGTLEPQTPGLILVDRSTPHAVSRKGLIVALDLECYDYRAGSQALIRATEGTVLDRIPPRVKIRENAPIETPHIMVLIDDPDKTVIEPLFEKVSSVEGNGSVGSDDTGGNGYRKLYDFELMQNGGHIKGWKVEDKASLTAISEALEKLADPTAFEKKYGLTGSDSGISDPTSACNKHVLLFAVGDGNHSLASAKAHWENVKAALQAEGCSTNGKAASICSTTVAADPTYGHVLPATSSVPDHPARYALVELVNVHDEGLAFEPIHRVLFGIDAAKILEEIKNACTSPNVTNDTRNRIECMSFDSEAAMKEAFTRLKATSNSLKSSVRSDESSNAASGQNSSHLLPFILEGAYGLILISNPTSNLEVGTLQSILDRLVKFNTGIEIDYIHGDQVVTEIGSKKNCMGFYLPVMNKHDLFRTVILDGVLPRKTFSMGEAEEKRYYLECRCIR